MIPSPSMVWLPADHRLLGDHGHQMPFLLLGDKYARAVKLGAHAQPVMFPLADAAQVPELLSLVDGVMLTGSPSNVHPSHFQEEVADPSLPLDTERDSLTLALVFRLIKFPASWMFGAMIASSLLHGAGLVQGGLPTWIRGVALVGIGALIGSRFARMKTKVLLGHINAALGSFVVAILVSAIFVGLIILTSHVRPGDLMVAFAPGAMDAMLALALTLHIDPIFVGAHHLSRFVFVTIATPGIVHLFGRPQDDVDD